MVAREIEIEGEVIFQHSPGEQDQTRTYLNRKKNKNKNKNKNIVLCSCALIFTVPGAMGINKMNNNRCNYTHLKPSIHS